MSEDSQTARRGCTAQKGSVIDHGGGRQQAKAMPCATRGSVFATKDSENTRQRQTLYHERQWKHTAVETQGKSSVLITGQWKHNTVDTQGSRNIGQRQGHGRKDSRNTRQRQRIREEKQRRNKSKAVPTKDGGNTGRRQCLLPARGAAPSARCGRPTPAPPRRRSRHRLPAGEIPVTLLTPPPLHPY